MVVANAEAAKALAETFGCPSCRVVPAEFPGRGSGMACINDVTLGERLLIVPLSRCWTAEAARASPEVSAILGDLPEEMLQSDAVLMSLHILAERAKGNAAEPHRKAHLAMLPKDVESLLSWSEEELEWIQGSKWHMVAKACADDIAAEYNEIAESLGPEKLAPFGPEAKEGYIWAQKVLLSRSIKFFRGEDAPPLECLVPLQDMLNHGGERYTNDIRAERVDGSEEECICVYASRDYVAGEEALHCYSSASNGRLLMGCGFVVEDNPNDSVELTLTLPVTQATLPIFRALAKACVLPGLAPGEAVSDDALERQEFLELPDDGGDLSAGVVVHFRLTAEKPMGEAHLRPFLRLACGGSPVREESSPWPAVAAAAALRDGAPSHDVERRALKTLKAAMGGMNSQYPQSLEQEEAELAALSAEDRSSRRGMALRVVVAEKRLFLAGIAAADAELSKIPEPE